MRFLITILIVMSSFIAQGQIARLDGPRYGIQVKAENTISDANKQLAIYRPFAPPFVYKIRVMKKCEPKPDEKSCSIKYEDKFRIILGLYKTKNLAQEKLDNLKKQNPQIFKDAFVQNVIE